MWDSLFCLRDSQIFGCLSLWTHYCLLLDGSLTCSGLDVSHGTYYCSLQTVLLNCRVSPRDALHCSFNASLQGCSEEAVWFPVWKLNLLRDQNRLRFLVSFCLFLLAYFSCSLSVCYLLVQHQI